MAFAYGNRYKDSKDVVPVSNSWLHSDVGMYSRYWPGSDVRGDVVVEGEGIGGGEGRRVEQEKELRQKK